MRMTRENERRHVKNGNIGVVQQCIYIIYL